MIKLSKILLMCCAKQIKFLIILSVSFPFLSNCTGPDESVLSPADDLMRVAVSNTNQQDVAAFNQEIMNAQTKDERWIDEPVSIIRRFMQWHTARNIAVVITPSGEVADTLKFLAIVKITSDDSVFAERVEGVLEQVTGARAHWRLREANISWLCVPDRGHQKFDVTPCV